MASSSTGKKPVTWGFGRKTVALSILSAALISIGWALGGRRLLALIKTVPRPGALRFHPVVLLFGVVMWRAWLVSPLLPLLLMAALFPGLGAWMIWAPASYRRHVDPRIRGFFWGWRYRYELREKLVGCRIVKETERTPTPVRTIAQGATVTLELKMIYGDSVQIYQDAADVLGPAFNALDAKAFPVYRQKPALTTRRPFIELEPRERPRHVKIEFLSQNPFVKPVASEYIDHWLDAANPMPAEGYPEAMRRNGHPYRQGLNRNMLFVGEPGSGKSGAFRARIYARRLAIYSKRLEVWGADGKVGAEISYMQHLFARYEYGDGNDPDEFYAEPFAQMFADARRVGIRRLRGMRGDSVMHIPTADAPALEIVVDDALVFNKRFVDPNVRNNIYSDMEFIQQNLRAACVTITAGAQDAGMDDLPIRRGFQDRAVGRVLEDIQVDMAAGRGAFSRGMKANRIPKWQQGTFYVESEGGTTPQEIRYPMVTNADIKALPPAPPSRLWKPITGYEPAPERQIDEPPQPVRETRMPDFEEMLR